MSLIEIRSLEFSYANGENILNIPEWSMAAGERVFLYGPSGTGKTTFLEILAGILKPQKGKVCILGQDLTTLNDSSRDHFRAAHLGYIFQSFNLIPYLNVEENIALPCYLSGERKKRLASQSIPETIHFLCERLGIAAFLKRKVTELSVGQQQRVAVARALLGKPDLILADEPTSALDMDHREQFLQLLFELCQESKASLIFVSHDRTIQHLFSQALSLQAINKLTNKTNIGGMV